MERLIKIFPNERTSLLQATLQKTNFLDEITSFNFDSDEDKKSNFTALLATFPNDSKLILESIFRHESWLKYTVDYRGDAELGIWKLKRLASLFPGYEKILSENVFSSKQMSSDFVPQLQALQANTSFKNLSPQQFLTVFLTYDPEIFLQNVNINSDENLFRLMELLPVHANTLFDRALTSDDFLKSIRVDYSRIDTIEKIVACLPKEKNSVIFEKLFGRHPDTFINVLGKHATGAPIFQPRAFDILSHLQAANAECLILYFQ